MKLPQQLKARVTTMLTLRAPSWPRRRVAEPAAAKENRSESDRLCGDDFAEEGVVRGCRCEAFAHLSCLASHAATAVAERGDWAPWSCCDVCHQRLKGPASADLTRALYLAGASADDLLEAEALRRESLTGSEAVLDASHEEYVRREELVAAAREVGWEPFSCEEIRAVTLER